jgi:hypothetical protein
VDCTLSIRPQLETELQSATTPKEIEKVFQEAVGVIIAEANDGKIEIDGATMSALRGIKFDHQHGTVTIGDAVIAAETLITGGSAGATGTTDIKGNTRLASKGTAIEVGKGAAIKITGGAKIKQT